MDWISDEHIAAVLTQYNPWWQDPACYKPKPKQLRRLVAEKAYLMIRHPQERHFAILSGMRFAGKTTCLFQIMEMLLEDRVPAVNIMYLSFENPILKYAEIDRICRIYMGMNQGIKGSRFFLFDDILYKGRWDSWISNIYDRWTDVRLAAASSVTPKEEHPEKSGEPQVRADQGAANMSRHWTVLTVPSLSFYESCRLREISMPGEYIDSKGIVRLLRVDEEGSSFAFIHPTYIQDQLIKYICRGGFPHFTRLEKEDYEDAKLGPDIMRQMIGNDILDFFNIRQPNLIEQLMLYLACKQTPVFVARQAAKDLGNISVTTLEQYIAILECAHLIYCSYPLDLGGKGACKGHPRIYIADMGIRNALRTHLPEPDVQHNDRELSLGVELALFRQLTSFYAVRRVKPDYYLDPIYAHENWDQLTLLECIYPEQYAKTKIEQASKTTKTENEPAQQPVARVGYYRKRHEPGKMIDLVVDLPEGQHLYHMMFYKRPPFRKKYEIMSLTRRPDAKYLSATIVTRRSGDHQTVGDGDRIFYQKEPASPILYKLGQDEYEWRKEELYDERFEHDTITGFDGAE